MQRVSNNPIVDIVPEYQIFNLTVGGLSKQYWIRFSFLKYS